MFRKLKEEKIKQNLEKEEKRRLSEEIKFLCHTFQINSYEFYNITKHCSSNCYNSSASLKTMQENFALIKKHCEGLYKKHKLMQKYFDIKF